MQGKGEEPACAIWTWGNSPKMVPPGSLLSQPAPPCGCLWFSGSQEVCFQCSLEDELPPLPLASFPVHTSFSRVLLSTCFVLDASSHWAGKSVLSLSSR